MGLFFRTSYIIQSMSASLGLYRLQQVDRQIDRARAQLETIRKALENDVELQEGLNRVTESQVNNHRAQNSLKNAEAEVDAQKIKIEHAESSLYGGRVQNPKELQDLQKDIVSLKKYIVVLEERQLEAMLIAESAENELQSAKTDLEIIQARLGNEHKNLIADRSSLSIELEKLAEEREATLAPIESSLIQAYEDLRQQKRGVAVTEINDNTCSSCGTTVNAALQQNARSQKQLAYCSSCGRILYSN
jgi:predicted  nucleic acid-binding Zn-ribbon protein